MRLDKMLGALAVCSRSQCRGLLQSGRVTVNGVPCRNPAAQVTQSDAVALDGAPLDTRLSRHLMLNKPSGVVTADEDSRCQTVMDILPPLYRALGCMPVGRLDKDTTGLMLLTTDGQLAHRLIAPKNHVEKVYEARVDAALDEADAEAFAAGVPLKDFTALPAKLEILAPDVGRVMVYEGKYHQIKRMFGARGKRVLSLTRLRFGPFNLDETLSPGAFRELSTQEAAALYEAAGME